MNKNCCKDTQTNLSIDDNQISSHTNFNFIGIYTNAVIPLLSYLIEVPAYSNSIEQAGQFYAFETGPPKTPIYIRLHTLII